MIRVTALRERNKLLAWWLAVYNWLTILYDSFVTASQYHRLPLSQWVLERTECEPWTLPTLPEGCERCTDPVRATINDAPVTHIHPLHRKRWVRKRHIHVYPTFSFSLSKTRRSKSKTDYRATHTHTQRNSQAIARTERFSKHGKNRRNREK